MQTRSLMLAAAFTAAALVLTTPAFADRNGERAGKRSGPQRIERLLDKVDADDETRAAIESIVEQSRAEGDRLHAEVAASRRALREMLHADGADREAILAHAETLGRLESDARIHRLDKMIRVREQLSPEQLTTLRSMRQARQAEILEACADDLATLCPDASPKSGRSTFRCLMPKKQELSEGCRDALPEFRHGRRDSRDRGDSPG